MRLAAYDIQRDQVIIVAIHDAKGAPNRLTMVALTGAFIKCDTDLSFSHSPQVDPFVRRRISSLRIAVGPRQQ